MNSESPQVPLPEAAKILHIRLDTLMAWIQEVDKNGRPVCPFGKYIKREGNHRGHYIILRERLNAYISGADLKEANSA